MPYRHLISCSLQDIRSSKRHLERSKFFQRVGTKYISLIHSHHFPWLTFRNTDFEVKKRWVQLYFCISNRDWASACLSFSFHMCNRRVIIPIYMVIMRDNKTILYKIYFISDIIAYKINSAYQCAIYKFLNKSINLLIYIR